MSPSRKPRRSKDHLQELGILFSGEAVAGAAAEYGGARPAISLGAAVLGAGCAFTKAKISRRYEVWRRIAQANDRATAQEWIRGRMSCGDAFRSGFAHGRCSSTRNKLSS
jgi:hypothetical protein